MGHTKLTARQAAFVREFLIDWNCSKSAERAGYSPRTSRQQGSRLLTNVDIQDAIAKAMHERNKRLKIDASYVLEQARKVHERCMQEVKPILDKTGKHVCDEDGNAVFKFDAAGALKALDLIGKHVDIMAFKERIGHEDDGLPIVIIHDPSIPDEEERPIQQQADED